MIRRIATAAFAAGLLCASAIPAHAQGQVGASPIDVRTGAAPMGSLAPTFFDANVAREYQAAGSLGSLSQGPGVAPAPTSTAPAVTVTPTVTAGPITVTPTVTAVPVTITPTVTGVPVTVTPTQVAPPVTVTPTNTASPVTSTPTVTAPVVTVTPTVEETAVVTTTVTGTESAAPVTVTPTVTAPPATVTSTVSETVTSTAVSTVTTTRTITPIPEPPTGDSSSADLALFLEMVGRGGGQAEDDLPDGVISEGEQVEYRISIIGSDAGNGLGQIRLEFDLDPTQVFTSTVRDFGECRLDQTSVAGSRLTIDMRCPPSGDHLLYFSTVSSASAGTIVATAFSLSGTDRAGFPLRIDHFPADLDGMPIESGHEYGIAPFNKVLQFPVS